jgi:enamine deaminase RidA (YjgF/YER057c/UK114 family)
MLQVEGGLTNKNNRFQAMNTVYTSYFKDPRPTRTTVIVSSLVGPGHVEITVTARK